MWRLGWRSTFRLWRIYFWIFKDDIVIYALDKLNNILSCLLRNLSLINLRIYGTIFQMKINQLNLFINRNMIKLIMRLIFILTIKILRQQTRLRRRTLHRSRKRLQIIYNPFQITRTLTQLPLPIIATSLIIQHTYN